MVVSKEQVLKHLDELEERVEILKKGSDALEKRALEQAEEIEQEKRRADNLLSQRNDLQRKLDGFSDLAKALGKIRGEAQVNPEQVRAMVKEELAAAVGSNPTQGVEGTLVTESVPNIELKVARPWLTLDESTLEGRVTILALGAKVPEKFVIPDVIKALELNYGWRVSGGKQSNRLKEALETLVGKYKTFERRQMPNGQWQYWLREDAKARVKESETREPVQVKDD